MSSIAFIPLKVFQAKLTQIFSFEDHRSKGRGYRNVFCWRHTDRRFAIDLYLVYHVLDIVRLVASLGGRGRTVPPDAIEGVTPE